MIRNVTTVIRRAKLDEQNDQSLTVSVMWESELLCMLEEFFIQGNVNFFFIFFLLNFAIFKIHLI